MKKLLLVPITMLAVACDLPVETPTTPPTAAAPTAGSDDTRVDIAVDPDTGEIKLVEDPPSGGGGGGGSTPPAPTVEELIQGLTTRADAQDAQIDNLNNIVAEQQIKLNNRPLEMAYFFDLMLEFNRYLELVYGEMRQNVSGLEGQAKEDALEFLPNNTQNELHLVNLIGKLNTRAAELFPDAEQQGIFDGFKSRLFYQIEWTFPLDEDTLTKGDWDEDGIMNFEDTCPLNSDTDIENESEC